MLRDDVSGCGLDGLDSLFCHRNEYLVSNRALRRNAGQEAIGVIVHIRTTCQLCLFSAVFANFQKHWRVESIMRRALWLDRRIASE
jgi:hypothetical protein